MSKDLIIIRGVPGSGKSTVAEIMKGNSGIICTTDDFYMVNGEYKFDPTKIAENHQKNWELADNSMKIGISPVIIANTNTTPKEWKKYEESAKKYGYRVHHIIVENRHGGKNEHGVPEPAIKSMRNKLKNNIQL